MVVPNYPSGSEALCDVSQTLIQNFNGNYGDLNLISYIFIFIDNTSLEIVNFTNIYSYNESCSTAGLYDYFIFFKADFCFYKLDSRTHGSAMYEYIYFL